MVEISSFLKKYYPLIILVIVAVLVGYFIWQESKKIPLPEVLELPKELILKEKIIPCIILDEEYCQKGELIYNEETKFVGLGFNLPEGTKIYAPFDGLINYPIGELIFYGVAHGFEVLEKATVEKEQNNYLTVLGEVETTIEPELIVYPEEPERLNNEPVQKGQLVAETTESGKRRVITPFGNYDIVIYFRTCDIEKNLSSYNRELLGKFFPYAKE